MVKKIITFLMTTLLIFSLVACGKTEQQAEKSPTQDGKEKNSETTDPKAVAQEGKRLVVYFSWSTSGNTEKMRSHSTWNSCDCGGTRCF